MTELELTRVALGLAVGLLLLICLLAAWRRQRRSLRARRRGARAVRGERAAAELLIAAGFEVLERQLPLDWSIAVDDDEVVIALRADYLVADGSRRLIAEVKTGDAAPLIANPATRRQLLEYLVAYDVDGVLLVDVEAGAIAEVEFFEPSEVRRTGS